MIEKNILAVNPLHSVVYNYKDRRMDVLSISPEKDFLNFTLGFLIV